MMLKKKTNRAIYFTIYTLIELEDDNQNEEANVVLYIYLFT